MQVDFDAEVFNMRFFERLFRKHATAPHIDNWYLKNVQPRMKYGQLRRIRFDPVQHGGSIIDVQYKGQTYYVNVQHLVTEDDLGNIIENIKFMHIKDTNPSHRCAFIQVNKKERVALVMHITKDFPCFTKDRQGRQRFDDVKEQIRHGDLLMETVISYCRNNKDSFGIDRLQLSDVSAYVCGRQEIMLEKARQLMGDDPYYMKFGFQSIESEANEILEHNRKIMVDLLAGDPRVKLITIINANVNENEVEIHQLLDLVENNLDQSLIRVMKMIFRWSCLSFYYIYDAVFRAVGLIELEGDASEYELIL